MLTQTMFTDTALDGTVLNDAVLDGTVMTRPFDVIERLIHAGRRRRYPRGSLLFAEGDDAHEVLVITGGSVKVLVTAPDGRQVVIDVLDAGALLGELAAVDRAHRTATAIALTPVDVVAVSGAEFRRLVRDERDVAVALVDLMAARLRRAAQRHVELGAADATARVCSRLLELAGRYGTRDSAGRTVLRTPLTQGDLAEWAGLSREAVVKALRSLREVRSIDVDGREVVILDHDALIRRAHQ